MLEPLAGASAEPIAIGGVSDILPVDEILERISDITRKDALERGAAGPPKEGAMPGGEPTDGVSQEGIFEPQG